MSAELQPKLSAALVKAQRSVKALEKDGDNKHHGYYYTTSEAVIDEGRKALSENGLEFDEATVATEWERVPPIVHIKYLLSHESGESRAFEIDWPVLEGKGRPLDKALAGSLTTALAYKLRGLLLIPRSDNIADMNKRDDRDHDVQDRRESNDDRSAPGSGNKASSATFEQLAEQIKDRKPNTSDLSRLLGETSMGDHEKRALFFVGAAYTATSEDQFFEIGASVRRDLEGPIRDLTLRLMKPAYVALNAQAK